MRTVGQYRSVADLASTVVKQTADGRFVRLGEVARVQDDWSRPTRHVRNNGKDAVTLEIVKKSGANTVDVAHAVRARMAEVVPGLGKGAAYEVIVDQSREIEANAHEVWIAIF